MSRDTDPKQGKRETSQGLVDPQDPSKPPRRKVDPSRDHSVEEPIDFVQDEEAADQQNEGAAPGPGGVGTN